MPVVVESSTHIQGVTLVRFQKFADSRGYFYESYRRSWIPGVRDMVQGNASFSQAGVLRGLHYHLKQADFWGVPSGRVKAALYDFRPASPTKGASLVVEMGRESPIGLYIPRGVAHGFVALEESFMTYLVDEYYDGADELGIRWNDPALGIDWGLEAAPILSDRDAKNPLASEIPQAQWPR
jgi:dTDP-4-dehydrorhamnose 3,5-epimerase